MEKLDHINLKTLKARFKSETPRFWKMIRRYMAAIGTLGAALMAVKMQYTMEWLPEKFCEYMVVAGVVGTALPFLTATDKYEPAPPQDNNEPK